FAVYCLNQAVSIARDSNPSRIQRHSLMMELDGTGRGPAGGKRIANLVSKLSAGGAASEADIRTAVDDFYEPSADGGGKQSQLTYECLALLCDAAGAGECGGAVVGGGRFSDCEAFLERLCFRLEQDRAQQKRKSASDGADVEISAIQLVANLPDEQLCKLLANREATTTLQGYVAEHPNAALRAFSISRLTSACTRCWSFLDRRAFLNGGCEEGGDAQRYKQRVRDWMYDFFSSLPKLCDDPSDAVAAAAFCAIGTLMGEHPLCTTLVDEDLRRFWGLEGGQQRHTTQMESGRGPWVGLGTSDGLFGRHKQVFPMQHVSEIILRSALPRIRRLLHRQSRMVLAREAHVAAPAIRTCAFLMIAALRLSTSSTGTPVKHALLETPTSVDFLGLKSDLRNGSAGGKNGAASTAGGEHKEQEDLDATLPPKELAVEWMNVRLRAILEEGRDGDAQLMEAAAWATLRVLHTVMMAQLRASTAPRVAEAFLRVLMVGQAATPKRLWPPLHAGQQEVAAGSALALRLASPSAAVALAPHVLAAAERVPQPRQRLSLLADTFFILLVRPGRNGRAPCGFGGARGARGAGTGVRSNSNGDGDGGGESNGFSRGKGGGTGARGRDGARRTGARMLVSVLEQDYFAQLVSDSPSSCRTRRLVFREEAVAALTTTCAQVLAAGVVSVLSSTAEDAAALGIGTLARSCHSHDAAVAAAAAAVKEDLQSSRTANGGPVHNETADFAARVSAAAAARAAAAAEKGRWSDLETWLDCSLSALEACTRCVNWTSVLGYVGGLAYVRLLSLVLRLLCPLTVAEVDEIGGGGGGGDGVFTDGIRSSGRFCGDRRGKRTKEQSDTLDDGEKAGGTGRREFSWARQRLAQVVDDLMWRLREGLPGRDVRLRLLQATCTHVRLSALVGGDDRLTEDSANELVSVLQGELGELDAQAGISTQPLRAPAATIEEGDDEAGGGDNANRRDANGGRGGGGGSSSSTTTAATAAAPGGGGGGAQNPPAGLVGGEAQEDDDETAERENGGGVGGQGGGSAVSFAGRRGSLTDVMAHELVIDCLVRLALMAEGEAAHEVLSVLEHERGRAHTRERLGRGAIGPMEEVVTKGIRAVQLLVLQTSSTSLKGTAGSSQAILLRRFLGTMDLGWQAAVQPDERALTGSSAGVFDHGAHAFPHLHQRLRSLLCGGVGVDLANDDEKRSRRERSDSGEKVGTLPSHFEAHAWEEEAPHAQLNGGSDPLVVTASHVVHYGGIGSGGRAGQGDKALGPTATMLAWGEGSADATVAPGGVAGKVASRGVRIRIRVYNGTNSRLHGLIPTPNDVCKACEWLLALPTSPCPSSLQVLMPSAVHTLEIPVMPLVVLADVIVHVSVVFPDTEPEPEFESEGIAELLGVETTPKEGGGRELPRACRGFLGAPRASRGHLGRVPDGLEWVTVRNGLSGGIIMLSASIGTGRSDRRESCGSAVAYRARCAARGDTNVCEADWLRLQHRHRLRFEGGCSGGVPCGKHRLRGVARVGFRGLGRDALPLCPDRDEGAFLRPPPEHGNERRGRRRTALLVRSPRGALRISRLLRVCGQELREARPLRDQRRLCAPRC
ncbi:unnamed protein product, partial [Scytosiphon promiscuus]